MRSRTHVRRGFSRRKSPFRVMNFASAVGLSFPANGTYGTNTVQATDTIIAAIQLLQGSAVNVPVTQYRGITIAGMRWSSGVVVNGAAVAGVSAKAVVSECIYVAELTAAGVPTTSGTVFLQKNMFAQGQATNPAQWPERILWRRQYMLGIGANDTGALSYQEYKQAIVEVIKTKVRLSERDALVWRTELSNPTATSVPAAGHALAAVAVKYDLD